MIAAFAPFRAAFVADFSHDGREIQLQIIAAGPSRAALSEVPRIAVRDFSVRGVGFFSKVEYSVNAAVFVGIISRGDTRARGAMRAGSDQRKGQHSIERKVTQRKFSVAHVAAENDSPCSRFGHSNYRVNQLDNYGTTGKKSLSG